MYKFTEDCLTGIEQVDTEHEKLFELINQTMDLLHNDLLEDKYHQVREVMEELKSYADTHFFNEEWRPSMIRNWSGRRNSILHFGKKSIYWISPILMNWSGSMTCLRSCWSIWCAGCIIIF